MTLPVAHVEELSMSDGRGTGNAPFPAAVGGEVLVTVDPQLPQAFYPTDAVHIWPGERLQVCASSAATLRLTRHA